ncbi:hypothetical protein O7621_16120 [Solwaraspora sp. WMMD937]|uniref:hypothetical protein n=1 Tax=Solwaraspora sp. WMMD937 TaxID=3016090 RepID=UPI00249B2DDA|nr:hypothetical protein [Solwaraspora sp. WMMD937]WFE19473.1 hypothetical protein O7621_16120 [Solwaraspora sp. WMMD937]
MGIGAPGPSGGDRGDGASPAKDRTGAARYRPGQPDRIGAAAADQPGSRDTMGADDHYDAGQRRP